MRAATPETSAAAAERPGGKRRADRVGGLRAVGAQRGERFFVVRERMDVEVERGDTELEPGRVFLGRPARRRIVVGAVGEIGMVSGHARAHALLPLGTAQPVRRVSRRGCPDVGEPVETGRGVQVDPLIDPAVGREHPGGTQCTHDHQRKVGARHITQVPGSEIDVRHVSLPEVNCLEGDPRIQDFLRFEPLRLKRGNVARSRNHDETRCGPRPGLKHARNGKLHDEPIQLVIMHEEMRSPSPGSRRLRAGVRGPARS